MKRVSGQPGRSAAPGRSTRVRQLGFFLLGLLTTMPGCDQRSACLQDGDCPAPATCNDGVCLCVPHCDGRNCGDDGCGGSCGSCEAECEECDALLGQCRPLDRWCGEGCGQGRVCEAPDEVCRPGPRGPVCFHQLEDCKTSGWEAGHHYLLTQDLLDVAGNCFVIDASDVELDLGGRRVTSARRPDVVVSGPLPGRYGDHGITLLVQRADVGAPPTFEASSWQLDQNDVDMCLCLAVGLGLRFCNQPRTLADLDGDDDLDLVTAGYLTDLRIFQNLNQEQFSPPFIFDPTQLSFGTRVFDFDQDGILDLFLLGDGTQEHFLRGVRSAEVAAEKRGPLEFVLQQSMDFGTYTHESALGEFSGDRRLDLVINSWSYNESKKSRDNARIRIATNLLQADETTRWVYRWMAEIEFGFGPTWVADFDQNGWDDLLTHFTKPQPMTYLRYNMLELQNMPSWENRLPLAVLDADQDGAVDLVLLTTKFNAQFHRNEGKLRFPQQHPAVPLHDLYVPLERDAAFPQSAFTACADLDGDADPDLLVLLQPDAGRLGLLINTDGQGRFERNRAALPLGDDERIGKQGLALRDFDGDGDLDLLAAIRRPNTEGQADGWLALRLYRNDGQGRFEPLPDFHRVDYDDGVGLYLLAGGDLTEPPATAIRLLQPGIRVHGAGVLRGFSVGVDVRPGATGARLQELEIEAPEVYGVRVDRVAEVTLERVRTRFSYLGTGLGLLQVGRATVQDCSFCGYRDPHDNPVNPTLGVYCVGLAPDAITGEDNRIGLNNGCDGLPVSTCQTAHCL